MPTFYFEYQILPEFREDAMTLIGGLEAYKHEMPETVIFGRWYTLGDSRGFGLISAPDVKRVFSWFHGWTPMLDITCFPVADDNQARRIILGREPDYQVTYDHVDANPGPGETLFFIKYRCHEGKREEGFEAFAKEKEEDAKAWAGNCTCLGRWHNLAEGCGYIVASVPSSEAIHKWVYDWAGGLGNRICDYEVVPVCNDQETREVISSKPGFKEKHTALMKKLQCQ